ncbi:MAG: hypothetical protein SRB2_01098 [Desulfobacteraceae bacterium Eth-SRB2]|nr:MAG: hypothetical protein SRB2_01098 [Desulfobacteraceae bacterium Eth-SRB2]
MANHGVRDLAAHHILKEPVVENKSRTATTPGDQR